MYEIWLQSPGGVFLTSLDTIISCQYARTENDGGELTLTVPVDAYDPGLFQPFGRILVMRSVNGQSFFVDLETPWFIVDGPIEVLDDEGSSVLRITCLDALGLILNSRNVAYNDNNEFTYKLDEADDMCKAVVRENMGSLATDTDRDLSNYLNVAPDVAAAPIIRFGSFARQQVLDVLQDIADASAQDDTPTWLGFDIVLANEQTGLLEFRTYVGQRGNDHSFPNGNPPLILSPNVGNLSRVEMGKLYKDAYSVIYAGGAGFGDIRPILSVENDEMLALSPFSRIEKFVDGSQILEVDSLEEFARGELEKARPKQFLSGTITETEGAVRGVHWDYGDLVAVSYGGATFNARVDKIAVRLEAAKGGGLVDSVEAHLRGEENV